MDEKLRNAIYDTVFEMIKVNASDKKIKSLTRVHQGKIHFIPIRYRILGGIIQSLNIKFGNFIEKLIGNIVELDTNVKVMPQSGKRIRLFFTPETDAAIDSYITSRQLPNSLDDCTEEFDELLGRILQIENSSSADDRQGIAKDVDGLFMIKDGSLVYTELKYNDDHDTGKFADINRKFIKTWAGLAVLLEIKKIGDLFPIIYYFNSTKRYGPIHTPSRNIMRGPQLFDTYLSTKYEDVDNLLSEIGDHPKVLEIFDDLYNRVRGNELAKKANIQPNL